MITLTEHHIGTYAKVLLEDWTIIRDILVQKTKLAKELVHHNDDSSDNNSLKTLLSDRQINDALNGPYQSFFKQHLAAYASLAHLTFALNISKGGVLKTKDFFGDIDYGLSDALLTQRDFPQVKDAKGTLDSMVSEHLMLWESQIDSWNEMLLSTLAQNDFTLNDIELNDFQQNETISELNDRFIDIKVDLPKLKKEAFNFHQYFMMKLTLAIHSALSRLHQPNTTKDIHVVLNLCQKQLKEIRKTEKELDKEQQAEIDSLIKPIMNA